MSSRFVGDLEEQTSEPRREEDDVVAPSRSHLEEVRELAGAIGNRRFATTVGVRTRRQRTPDKRTDDDKLSARIAALEQEWIADPSLAALPQLRDEALAALNGHPGFRGLPVDEKERIALDTVLAFIELRPPIDQAPPTAAGTAPPPTAPLGGDPGVELSEVARVWGATPRDSDVPRLTMAVEALVDLHPDLRSSTSPPIKTTRSSYAW